MSEKTLTEAYIALAEKTTEALTKIAIIDEGIRENTQALKEAHIGHNIESLNSFKELKTVLYRIILPLLALLLAALGIKMTFFP